MDSSSTRSIPTPVSSTINRQSFAKKLIQHGHMLQWLKSSDGKKLFICNFCEKVIKVGSINRMKMHLIGQSGDAARCKKVHNDVCFLINESLKEIAQRKFERRMNIEEGNPFR